MYFMTYHTGERRYNGRFNSELDINDNFRIGILDTDDMVEEDMMRFDLENIFRNSPSVEVAGIRHDKSGRIVSIYDRTNNYGLLIDDNMEYAVHYEQFTNRGNFIKFQLFKRGVGLIAEQSSGHARGHLDFDLRNLEVSHTDGGDMIMIDVYLSHDRTYQLNDIVVRVNSKGVEFMHFPDEQEVRRF